MITKIDDKIWKIRTPILDANSYLVNIDVPTLIDMGHHEDTGKLIEEIESIGYKTEDIKRIVYTHLHADHSGNPTEFHNARIFASYNEIKNVKSLKMLFTFDDTAYQLLDKVKLEPLKDTIGPFEVIPTPGHTSGSICLLLKDKNFMFTGDTVFGRHVGRTDVPSGSEKDLRSSLEKLKKVNAKILPGHDYG